MSKTRLLTGSIQLGLASIQALLLLGSCDFSASDPPYNYQPYEVEELVAFAPQHVQPALRFKQLSAGRWFFCGLTIEGEIWCWGQNNVLQLGAPSEESYTEEAIRVGIEEEVVSIASGLEHSCALTNKGEVYCWGQGDAERGGRFF